MQDDSTTSDDEKTVHQQCIEPLADQIGRMVHAFDRGDGRQNEVRKLASIAAFIESERDRLREERDMFCAAGHAAELKIVELKAELEKERELCAAACSAVDSGLLRAVLSPSVDAINAKLARVEALPARWRNDPRRPTHFFDCADDVEEALRDDPQPSAATNEVAP